MKDKPFKRTALKAESIFRTVLVVNVVSLLAYSLFMGRELQTHDVDEFLEKDIFKPYEGENLFKILGAYPRFKIDDYKPKKGTKYHFIYMGLFQDNDYCERVDAYNLANPDNIFEKKKFFTDFPNNTLPRISAMQKVGTILNKNITRAKRRTYHLSHEINNFYTELSMHKYHKLGKHFLCATQMYNHIPGNAYLVRKTEVIEKTILYAKKYEKQPQCFNKNEYFLRAYRLYVKEECKEFFNIINSPSYKNSLEIEPIQYLIKKGIGSHKSLGVSLLDDNKTQSIHAIYDSGLNCGQITSKLIAQKYITNPLLLNMNNKFDFRIYMLIASTNPLIVYYHDVYLRVSVNTFDKSSTERATHLTNTYVATKVLNKMKKNNETVNGMNAKELKKYHLWGMKDLETYLLGTGKISDPNWLDNYLRPAFQKAFIHLVKMTSGHYYKQSNVYELHGLDFMLDDQLKLWFIEDNSNPLLSGVKSKLISTMLKDLYEIQYAYYRSRMKRVLEVVHRLRYKLERKESVDYDAFREEYRIASVNRLEPEYKIRNDNSFVLILDETLPPNKALLGHLPSECF